MTASYCIIVSMTLPGNLSQCKFRSGTTTTRRLRRMAPIADLGYESISLGYQLLSAEFDDTIPWNFRPAVVYRGAPSNKVALGRQLIGKGE